MRARKYRENTINLTSINPVIESPSTMSQQAGKPSQKELSIDIWTNVCDILLAEELDGTAAALARTCRGLHRVTTPKLFNTPRLRNLEATQKFFNFKSPQAPALRYNVEATLDLVENEVEWSDARTLIRHLEIQCVLQDEEECVLGQPWGLPSRLSTCHLRTSWQQGPGNSELLGHFVESITERMTAKHFRWEHRKHVDEDPSEHPSILINTIQDARIASLQLPEECQIAFDTYYLGTSILFNTRALGHRRLIGEWYTNPHKNEKPGTRFEDIKFFRSLHAPKEVKPWLVQIGNPLTGSDDDPDRYAILARSLAGTLTDFIVMERMGLIHPKVVTIPDRFDPVEWRKWVMGEALVVGKGVQSDLRDLVS
jgi:hypothetical protein